MYNRSGYSPVFVNDASFKNGKHKTQLRKNLMEIYATFELWGLNVSFSLRLGN